MKYIRKEIIKGIEPIADQDLNISGNLTVAGNIAVTGTGLPTKSTLGLDFNDVFYEDVTNSLNAKTNAQNLGDGTRYWRLIVNDAVVASVTSTTSTAVSATHPLWTYNGNTYGMYNFATSSQTLIGNSTINHRVYKINHLPGDVLEFDQTTEKFKPKRYDTLWDAKASGTGAAVLTSNLVNSVNGQTGAVTIATGGAVKQHSQYFYSQSATGLSLGSSPNFYPQSYDLVNGSTGITITKQDSATKLSAVTHFSITLTGANMKYIGSVAFDKAFQRTTSSSATAFGFGPVFVVDSPTHNVLADGNFSGNGSYNLARMGNFINYLELDTGGQYAANTTWTSLRIVATLQPFSYWASNSSGVSAAITAVTTILES